MKHGFRLMFQKDLNDEEKLIAYNVFSWFVKKTFNPETWNEELKRFMPIEGVKLPSWKHLTRGGHQHGLPLQRGKWGMRLDHHGNKEVGKTLLFRRHGKKERLFVVQRTDTVDVMRVLPRAPDVSGKGCVCNSCMGGRPGRSKLTLDNFEEFASVGDSKG